MPIHRISASSYSNTAPLVWSFLYGQNHGKVELILDNAPARSAELLAQDRVDAALVPVICSQTIDDVKLIADVCVGTREKVRSVCLVTDGRELSGVKSVALDISSKTSVVLTKIIYREFLGFEPTWIEAEPNIDKMLSQADAALIIGDPALSNAECRMQNTELHPKSVTGSRQVYDLAELWHQYTGQGFVFAMWMTRRQSCSIDFGSARDEGLAHIDAIAANYAPQIGFSNDEMRRYLTENVVYSINDSMQRGMDLYFELAARHKFIKASRPLEFV